ncbi:glycosyltransferase [Candidatus Poribacteria bacterium]|nr:glycosyltransferase [Candidatus Poribacteria bacterium]
MKRIILITTVLPAKLSAGDRVYIYHLVKSLMSFAEVLVVGHSDNGEPCLGDFGHKQFAATAAQRSKAASLFSLYPNIIYQDRTAGMFRLLERVVPVDGVDAVICDHLRTYWAIEKLKKRFRQSGNGLPRTVLVMQNHETLARQSMAEEESGIMKRWALRWDARKVKHHEQRAIKDFDRITAITADDARTLNRAYEKEVTTVTPGYSGTVLADRQISCRTRRQAVMLGSFFWQAKQINLRELALAAGSRFASSGVSLKIVGTGPAGLFKEIAGRTKAVEFIGWVESLKEILLESRVAIVAEKAGGGFKLKSLDYVFHRVPIAALKGTMAGLPLVPNRDYLEFDSIEDLVGGVIEAIDDIDRLNRISKNAFDVCRDKFDWGRSGELLFDVATGRARIE